MFLASCLQYYPIITKGDIMNQSSIKYGILVTLLFVWASNANIVNYKQKNIDSINTEFIIMDSIPHPHSMKMNVYFFRPANATTPRPTIYFCHGIGVTHPDYYKLLIDYVVSHNVNVCFSTYKPVKAVISPRATYSQLWSGFVAGHRKWKGFIDDTQIGFIGHSYGGGAAVHMAWRAVHKMKWGSKGCFIYAMAPWYCHKMNTRHFKDFPSHTILVTQVFEDDYINDYRIAQDIFHSFKIPENRKCFITVFTAKKDSVDLPAGHCLPGLEKGNRYLGRYIVNPVIDSLMYYTFNESYKEQSGRIRKRGQLRKTGANDGLECTFLKGKKCAFTRPQCKYLNFWGHAMNPRFKGTRLMPPPVRLCVQTPQTVIRYFTFGISQVFGKDECAIK